MRSVKIDCGPAADALQAARPPSACDPPHNCFVADMKATLGEDAGGCCSRECIANLKTTGQGRFNTKSALPMSRGNNGAIAAVQGLCPVDSPKIIYFEKASPEFSALPSDDRTCLRTFHRAYNPGARLDNSRFFACDFLNRVPEKILVVKIDWRDDGSLRLHDVGGVEAPAHSHFINRNVDAARGECHKR